MMQRMQQKQKEAVEGLGMEGHTDDSTAEDSEVWQCATCREAGSQENPLAMLAAVGEFRGRSHHLGGHPGFRRFTSCRHMVHISCGQRHALDGQSQAAALRRFSFYNIEGGEFGCPMCRSVANCLVPCVPDKELFESPSSWDEACVVKMRPAPWLISHVEKCGTLAVGTEESPSMRGALALLRGACAELVTSARLNPQALADEGPPPPLFAALLQGAAALRYESDDPLPQSSEENWQAKIFQRLAKPRAPWLADPRAVLGELVLASLSREGALSPITFSEYVKLLLEVKTSQARSAAGTRGVLEEEIQTYVLKKQTDFLIFAAWLATAIWRFSPQERNRLAYLEIGTAESFTQLSHQLRLPGLAVEVPEALPSTEGELEDATVDSFIAVPEVYLDLLKDVRKRPCSKCQRLPDEPAMCLLCGAIVCVGRREDCRGSDTEGQCTTHARECTAGQSLFLLPYMAQVLAVSAPDCCLWDCPYVDKNGEPNPRLKRPCLMNFRLDARRWDNLRQIFVKSAVRREIFLYNEKTGQYIPEAL